MESLDDIKREYLELSHAMQSGVAMWMNYDQPPGETHPKHLRTGVNSALVDSGSLAGLLIAKGIITEREYYTALRDRMREEVGDYTRRIEAHLGGATKITLR